MVTIKAMYPDYILCCNFFSKLWQAIIQPTSDLEQEVQALRARVESLKSQEAVVCSSIEQKRREEKELEQRVMDLKREETRLKQICDEREGQLATQSEVRLMDVGYILHAHSFFVGKKSFSLKYDSFRAQHLLE